MSFNITLDTMIEAGKERYFVRIIHPDRPKDVKPWDEGYMDLFSTLIKEHAEMEKERWEEFLNYKGINI